MKCDASEMLLTRTRRKNAPSGGKKVSPRHARYFLSSMYFPDLSHVVVCQIEGEIPSTYTRWSYLGTDQIALRTAKEVTEISITGGSPSGGSYPLKPNNCHSIE